MENNKGPEHTLRDAHLKASIWRNEGEKGAYYTTTLARTYKDEQGNLHDTQSFSKNDLLKVAELARGAYNHINDLHRGQSQSHNAGDGDAREAFREKRQEKNASQREAPAHDR